jgi:hypothetical protein
LPPRDEPAADLHSPEELLATAEALVALGDPQMYRAAVLEAITALEAYVALTVFERLEHLLDPLLVRWLRDHTRMDFDARLSVLTPVATGRSVDTRSTLWQDYKSAKEIRNRVTHSGARVSYDRAVFVLSTVRQWMAFVGSTAELTVTLDGLRRYVETARVPIRDGRDASAVVRRYFAKSPRDMVVWAEQRINDLMIDFVLRFAEQRVAVEVKFLQRATESGERAIRDVAESFATNVRRAEFTRGALVVFMRAEPPEAYRVARVVEDGDVSIVVIHAPG